MAVKGSVALGNCACPMNSTPGLALLSLRLATPFGLGSRLLMQADGFGG
jgi:hypothetical protein